MDNIDLDEVRGDIVEAHFEDGKDESDEEFLKLADFMSSFRNPSDAFRHIKKLKEQGNKLFKQGKFQSALDDYDLALKSLPFIQVRNEVEKSEFLELSFSLLLNEAACALKLDDCMRAGQLCSIILGYDLGNVKALYRRAMAAIGLEKLGMAHSDLQKANEVDPTNKEVTEKLKEVKDRLFLQSVKLACQRSSHQDHCDKRTVDVVKPKGGVGALTRRIPKSKPKEDSKVEEMVIDSPDPSAPSQHEVPQELSLVDTCFEVVSDIVDPPPSNHYPTKPHYQFRNRRRGSFLQISPATYQSLLQGKNMCFYNSSQYAVMQLRVVGKSLNLDDKRLKEEVSQLSEIESCVVDRQSSVDLQDDADSLRSANASGIGSCPGETMFWFKAKAKAGRRLHTKHQSHCHKRKRHGNFISQGGTGLYPVSNGSYECRQSKGVKRRLDLSPSFFIPHPVKRRSIAISSWSNPNVFDSSVSNVSSVSNCSMFRL